MRDPNALLVEMKIGAALVELVCPLFTKVENGLPYNPATPLLGMYPKNSISTTETRTSAFMSVPLTLVTMWKQQRCPSTNEWTLKIYYIYTVIFYSIVKKK